MTNVKLRREIIAACLSMNNSGLNQGTSGNISARVNGGMLITPSGVAYDNLTPADIVFMAADGAWRAAEGRKPSSEWRFHLDIYNHRDDAQAIVHTHSMHATALSMLRRDVPACHYMIGFAGGDSLRCADYATFGTQALSDNALKALDNRRACLLANHGMIVFGETLTFAMWLATEVETLCAQYWRALQVGEPVILNAAEMRRIVKLFGSGYGVQDKKKTAAASKPAPAKATAKPKPAPRKTARRRAAAS